MNNSLWIYLCGIAVGGLVTCCVKSIADGEAYSSIVCVACLAVWVILSVLAIRKSAHETTVNIINIRNVKGDE